MVLLFELFLRIGHVAQREYACNERRKVSCLDSPDQVWKYCLAKNGTAKQTQILKVKCSDIEFH